MHHVQLNAFTEYTPPPIKRLFSFQFITSIVRNILTLGVDAAIQTIHHRYSIQNLKKQELLLLAKSLYLEQQRQKLSGCLIELIDKVLVSQSEDEMMDSSERELEVFQEKLNDFLAKKESKDFEAPQLKEPSFFEQLKKNILISISLLGQISFDLISLGYQGCYQNVLLKNRIKLLKSENNYFKKYLTVLHKEHYEFFLKTYEGLKKGIQYKYDLIGIQHTDSAKAFFELSEIKRKFRKLKEKQNNLEKKYDQLQVEHKIAKEAQRKLKILQPSFDALYKANEEMKLQVYKLQEQSCDWSLLYDQSGGKNRKDLSQNTLDLQKRIGPIPRKYQPKKEELESLEKLSRISGKRKIADLYANRYKGLDTATAVFKAGFAYSLTKLFKLADQGKIKLNRSLSTPLSKGAQAVYRFLVLDWIKEGKLFSSCHGHELHLNEQQVKLVFSMPENMLKYKKTEKAEKLILASHFQRRDDFTPSEEELKHSSAACGIDPISAKCLFAKLSSKEKEHLLHLLLEPVMENDHPDYLAALNFVSKQSIRKQKYFSILLNLLSDIAIVIEVKFRQNIAMLEWRKHLDCNDFDLQPFRKQEDMYSIANIVQGESRHTQKCVPWQIQHDILSVMNKKHAHQADFASLVMDAKEKYQVYFKNLCPTLLRSPGKKGGDYVILAENHLEKQYYITHQVIGSEGCLLSNILAIFMLDTNHLKEANIKKLKMAMASYLDCSEHAKKFEANLKNDFKCTVKKFQKWLRGEDTFLDNQDLTPTVLEIVAYTIGVRIALFSLPSNSQDKAFTKCKTDKYGRLVPVENICGHYFGPLTQEVFFMAVENNLTYYGLFPKIKLNKEKVKELGIRRSDLQVIEEIDKYWREIKESSF